MILELGMTYLTKHGRFVKITDEPWAGVFNGQYEKDNRIDPKTPIYNEYGRWLSDGRAWNFIFPNHEFYFSEHDVIMTDCKEARNIAEVMKINRKQKAYDETN